MPSLGEERLSFTPKTGYKADALSLNVVPAAVNPAATVATVCDKTAGCVPATVAAKTGFVASAVPTATISVGSIPKFGATSPIVRAWIAP